MNKEELNSIQELIDRKILLAEVSGGLTSSDKKFINLWNYTIELQQRIDKAIEYIENKWYSKETRNINNIVSLGDPLLDMLAILKGDNNGRL